MNILGLCGSSRENSNSEILLKATLSPLIEAGCRVRYFKVGDMNINPCNGCELCQLHNACVYKDDMIDLINDFCWADALVISTPVYYRNITSKLMAIFERIYSSSNLQPLEGKLGSAIAVGRGTCGGQTIALNIIHNWMLSCGVICIPGEINGISAVADYPGAISQDERKMAQANALGEKILKYTNLLHKKV